MITITEKRFLQLLVLLPVLVPIVSLPLFVVPFLSLIPVILLFSIWEGWVQYLLFCMIAIPITAAMQSTKSIIKFYFYSPLIFAIVFYLSVEFIKYINSSEEYVGYHFGNIYGVIFIVVLICYFYVGVGTFLHELFLQSKYLKK
jgi:hypothetical protein